MSWLANVDLALLCTVLITVGGVWAFVEIASEVRSGDTREFDEYLVRYFRNPADLSDPIGPRWLSELARDVTALGGVAALTLVTASVAGYLWLVRKTHAFWLVIAATVGAAILSYLLKDFFDRARPALVPHLRMSRRVVFRAGTACCRPRCI